MAQTASPLQVIQQKEAELKHRLEEARQKAEADIEAAREEARQLVDLAHRQGQAEAEALYQKGIQRVEQEAEAVLDAAHKEEITLRRQAKTRLEDAVTQIVQLVLPSQILRP
jgi:vacuolar-type H+-ATPase subunit H